MTKRPDPGGLRRKPGSDSFSLVEVLVSIAILSILIIILLSMLGSLTTAWQLGQGHNERRNVAEAVFDRMSRDLSQVALPMSRVNTNSLELIINPSTVTATYRNPQAFFWQAPVATDGGTSGNLAEVGYFVEWVNGTPGTPCLARLLINPSSTDYSIYSSPTSWISDALLGKYAPASYISATASNNYAGLMAENVLGLWVQALGPDGNSIVQSNSPSLAGEAFDSRYPYAYANPYYSGIPQQTNIACALPASMQVAIAVMDTRTAQRLAITGKPTYPALSGNFWADVQGFYNGLPKTIRQGTEIETVTIPLANGPR
jgi:hypothetical protein